MGTTAFRAKKLLQTAARAQQNLHEDINKEEIAKKIDEIKYLSTQKNVPRLSLRKEIVHLESKLQSIFILEEKLLKKEEHESRRVASLKRQISSLKSRLNAADDKELRDKVGRLYHILSELLAKSDLKQDVALSQSLLHELQNVDPKQAAKEQEVQKEKSTLKMKRVSMLLHRIKSVKHELELKAELLSSDPAGLAKIREQIAGLEIKIQELQHKFPEVSEEVEVLSHPKKEISSGVEPTGPPSPPVDVKHTMIMDAPIAAAKMMAPPVMQTTGESGENMSSLETALHDEQKKIHEELIAELPLPPPPRIRKK